MDIYTDLTSRTVTFLTIFQDLAIKHLNEVHHVYEQKYGMDMPDKVDADKYIDLLAGLCKIEETIRIEEVVWISEGDEYSYQHIESYFSSIKDLIQWLGVTEFDQQRNYNAPYKWRIKIREKLFNNPSNKFELVKILNYMPIQIILAIGNGKESTYHQRLYQVWFPRDPLIQLSDKDVIKSESWWGGLCKQGLVRTMKAIEIIHDDKALLLALQKNETPIPFETLFNEELDEITEARRLRGIVNPQQIPPPVIDLDPILRAEKLELKGLAFSGGGIRSATFNLGILQKLAQKGFLPTFDYLSTVSGGGYIGSWLTSWIYRTGDIKKVVQRLDPKISPDPMAAEVRPISWIRMFSNYLAPNSTIMSVDAWVVGITWLRNALINQVILFLGLFTILVAIHSSFDLWLIIRDQFKAENIINASLVILVIGSIFAGFGMHAYEPKHSPKSPYNIEKNKYLPSVLLILAMLFGFVLSIWLSKAQYPADQFLPEIYQLKLPIAVGFVCMMLVAILGRYDKSKNNTSQESIAKCYIFLSSVLAAISAVFLLVILKNWFSELSVTKTLYGFDLSTVIFIFGPPAVLEVIAISVVVRMVVMGRYFPDEKREWWGRMGAILHRTFLFWIILGVIVLMMPAPLKSAFAEWKVTLPAGLTWGATIGYGINLAFSPKVSGEKEHETSTYKKAIITVTPYLFTIGFLIGGVLLGDFLKNAYLNNSHLNHKLNKLILILLLGGLTLFLSNRAGVNEFSLHYFYRNRLIRAYLGATRRRTDRENTENKFTGFDGGDDVLLANLLSSKGYTGPYPIINTTLNATIVSDQERQDRKAESFVFTPKYCGFDFTRTRSAAHSKNRSYEFGYRETKKYTGADGPTLGTAMAISGAAVHPSTGYHSSAAIAFLLTVFNIRLGWWIGNPRNTDWKEKEPRTGLFYLLKDMLGKTDTSANFVCLSDGGHFDNMGLYELIRRRCTYILLCDAEQDGQLTCEGLANAIRRCRIDFGVEIDLDLEKITKLDAGGFSSAHGVKGSITYMGDTTKKGVIVYVKACLTNNLSVDIKQYKSVNKDFPQESTADQFFDESQFESYRKLGFQSV